MLPSSLLGAAVLLCLIPGLLYVRMVERTRHPRESSALLEGVEVLAMGLLSIALVVAPWALISPDGLRSFAAKPGEDLRRLVAVGTVLFIGSTAAAYSIARLRLAQASARYTPTVWTATFDEFRRGFVREAMVELLDGRRFQGTLFAYTLDPAVEQQITLSAPITRVDVGLEEALGQERMAFSGAQISSVSMMYSPDGAEERSPETRHGTARLTRAIKAAWRAAAAEWASH